MVHLLFRVGNTRPWGKIAGVALFVLKLLQLIIARIQPPSNFQALAKLN
jgi:hypothetical protein